MKRQSDWSSAEPYEGSIYPADSKSGSNDCDHAGQDTDVGDEGGRGNGSSGMKIPALY